jgi:hypothetical protein
MHFILIPKRLLACLAGYLFFLVSESTLKARCACDEEQKVTYKLRGVGMMAGSASVRITWGDNEVFQSMAGGTTSYVGANARYEAISFECVQWDAEVTVDPKLNQSVQIEYVYETNDQDPNYTEFQDVERSNPVTFWTRPSSSCLTTYFDRGDGNWVPASDFFEFGDVIRMKGVMPGEPRDIGESSGPVAGGGMPVPSVTSLTDAPSIGDLSLRCPGGGSMAMTSAVATNGARKEKESARLTPNQPRRPRYAHSAAE